MKCIAALVAGVFSSLSLSRRRRQVSAVRGIIEPVEPRVHLNAANWFSGDGTFDPVTRELDVNGTATIFNNPGADSPYIVAGEGANLTINPASGLGVHISGLNLTDGAQVTLAPLGVGRSASNHRALFVDDPGEIHIDELSTLDLTDGGLALAYSLPAQPAADVEGLVARGYNGGDWLGTGITSSFAAEDSNTALGALDQGLTQTYGSGYALSLFAGEDVDDTTVLVNFTYRADLDLDGAITSTDAVTFSTNYQETAPGVWAVGDVDYDGTLTTTDATIFATNYNEAMAPPAAPQHVTAAPHAGTFYAVDLDWEAVPGSGITYSVFAGATPDFIPSNDTLLASGITTSNYTADTLDDSTTYYFKVTADGTAGDDPTGGTTSTASAANDGDEDGAGDGVTTPESDAVEGWIGAFPSDDIQWTWSQEPDDNNPYTGPVTLTISGVPAHTLVHVTLSADLVDSTDPGADHTMTITAAGTSYDETVNFFGAIGHSMVSDVPDIQESTSTLTIEFNVELLGSERWTLAAAGAYVYTPKVTVTALDSADEDGNPGAFRVARTGPTVGDLPVTLQPPTGTAERPDYEPLPKNVTILDGDPYVDVPLIAKDDAVVEPTETVELAAAQRPFYALEMAAPPAAHAPLKAVVPIGDNDFTIKTAHVAFDDQGVRLDTGSQHVYSKPQWVDDNNDKKDDRPSTPALGSPISYQRSTPAVATTPAAARKVTASLTFTIECKDPGHVLNATFQIEGAGTGPGGGSFAGDYAGTHDDGHSKATITASCESDTALPETIKNGELSIAWKIRRTKMLPHARKNQSIKDYATTKNHIYVTGVDVTDQLETVLDLGCSGADGKRPENPAEVVDGIWGKFSGRETKRVDGTVMTYWGAHAGPSSVATDLFDRWGLVKNADGRCGAWADLLVATLGAQGINAHIADVHINTDKVALPPREQDTPPVGDIGEPPEVAMDVNKPAQGNDHPFRYFPNHSLVRVDGITGLYDPSYGGKFLGATADEDWQDAAISRFCYEYKIATILGHSYDAGLFLFVTKTHGDGTVSIDP